MVDFKSRFVEDLRHMDQLPSLPTVVTRLMAMINDPKVPTQDLAQALREDPPLTARVLRLANSPVWGGGARIMSVPDAVMRLGLLEVQNLVMSVSLLRSLLKANKGLDYRAFWNHWFTVATAAEALAKMAPSDTKDQDGGAFTAGLLHDIGRFVLAQFYPEANATVGKTVDTTRLRLVAAEQRVLGIDHAEAAGLLAARWGLPKPIVAGITYHHRPEEAEPELRRLALLVRVAEQTCEAFGIGDPLEGEPVTDASPYWEAIGVDPEQAKTVVDAAVASAAKSAVLLQSA